MLKVKCRNIGALGANHYLIWDEERDACALIECAGKNAAPWIERGREMIPSVILLTHGHFDHCAAARTVSEKTGAKIYLGNGDIDLVSDAEQILMPGFSYPIVPFAPDFSLFGGERIPFGDTYIEVIATPGHTPGGVCYRVGDMLFTGDTLMAGCIGRTDFPGGDTAAMGESLRKIADLEGNLRVYPGHGEVTTLERERRYNPYLT